MDHCLRFGLRGGDMAVDGLHRNEAEPTNGARVRVAGVYRVQQPELPHPQGNAGHGAAGAEEILSEGPAAYCSQGIAEEMNDARRNPNHEEARITNWCSSVRALPFVILSTFDFRHAAFPPTGVAQLAEQRIPNP